MLFTPDFRILVISKDKEAAKEVVTIIRLMFEELPSWLKNECSENNKMSLKFNNGSSIIAFASSPEAGRSKALSLLILDEAAFIKDIDTIWTAAAPAVTSHGTDCIVLSTPNGVGNFFHKTWVKAEEDKYMGGTMLKFVPTRLHWSVHPERDQTWRDAQVEILGSERRAAQECDADFLTSGHTVISAEVIAFYKNEMIKEPIERRYLESLWIWEPPDYSKSYMVVADVSRGDASDYSAAHIIEVETLTQVGEFKGHLSTIEFSNLLVSLATEYNEALLVIENSNLGWSTVLHTTDVKRYQNTYYSLKNATLMDAETHILKSYDMVSKENMVPGFSNTFKVRPLLISKLETYMRNKEINIFSSRTLGEFETFVWMNYKPQAMYGYNDDLIMALAIALWVRDTALSLRDRGIELTKKALSLTTKTSQQYQTVYNTARTMNYNPYTMNVGPETEDISWIFNQNEQDVMKKESDNVRSKYDKWRDAYKNPQN